MHYFDTRGIHRIFKVTPTGDAWEMAIDRHSSASSFASPDAPFSLSVTYTFEDGEGTHYLNSPIELAGGVLELIRACRSCVG